MQKRINSRSKGARTEKALITFMEVWSGYEFSRVPASGDYVGEKQIILLGILSVAMIGIGV